MNNQRGKPYRQNGISRIEQAGKLQADGMSNEEIAVEMGVTLKTARVYLAEARDAHVAPGPRCMCGLLLPCTCTRPMRVEDFLGRREEQNAHEFNGRYLC